MLELDLLKQSLSDVSSFKINEMIHFSSLGNAKLPIKKKEITKVYQDASKPNSNEAYSAALKFLKNDLAHDSHLYDLVSFALNTPITELFGETIISNKLKLSELLGRYSNEIDAGEFWELTWFGVLQSYFQISNFNDSTEQIRVFLESKFKKIFELSEYKPFWMTALKENQHLLSKDPCHIYALEWLHGKDDRVTRIKSDIQIPENSWFWEKLIVSCIRETTNLSDVDFKESIPKLLNSIKQHPAYLDFGLHAALARYQNCTDRTLHKDLKNFAVETWKSPRLRNVGGSKWLQIEEPIWQMVLRWVNEANLRLFFQLLKHRGVADKNRLDFWLKYINQVSWTKLVLGDDTQEYFKRNKEMTKIFENESDSFSSLDGERNLDAFIIQIGDYLIVEFSTEGGCYIYKNGENTFDPNAIKLKSSTSKGGLKEKRRIKGSPDIIHTPGWQNRAENKLMKLSIFPDAGDFFKKTTTTKSDTHNYYRNNPVDIRNHKEIQDSQDDVINLEQTYKIAESLALKYGIKTENLKYKNGNYWIYLDRNNGPVADKLKELGFNYISGKGWWIK